MGTIPTVNTTTISKLIARLKTNNIPTNTFRIEIDNISNSSIKSPYKSQQVIIKELGILKDETMILLIENEVYSVSYKNPVLHVNLLRSTYSLDKNLIARITQANAGIVLVNDYPIFNNKHIETLTDSINEPFTATDDLKVAMDSVTNIIYTAFTYTEKEYEMINDLLSQGKKVIIPISKFSINDIIISFTNSIPDVYKTNIVNNLIACLNYYIMPLTQELINDYIIGVSAVKNDILKGKFTSSTIDIAKEAFATELDTGLRYNAKDSSKERLDEILRKAVEAGASDISLSSGFPPMVRVRKVLIPLENSIKLTPEILYSYSQIVLKTDDAKRIFEQEDQVDYAYTIYGLGRFRVAVYKQQGSTAFSFRKIDENAWTVEKAGIPKHIVDLFDFKANETSTARKFKDGLIMITGAVNTGKSTTMNAIINHINETKNYKIITIEQPIEAIHKSKLSLIEQREIGTDCPSYEAGLNEALRSDPDVISIGEVRTLEGADTTLKVARSGHLAMLTLHTPDAIQTIQSYLQMFPEASRPLVRTMLAESLRMVYSQKLLPRKGGGLIAIQEILLNTGAVRAILSGENNSISSLANAIQAGSKDGMITMDRALANAYLAGQIELDVALANASDVQTLKQYIDTK